MLTLYCTSINLSSLNTKQRSQNASSSPKLGCWVIWRRKAMVIALCEMLPSRNCRLSVRSVLELEQRTFGRYACMYAREQWLSTLLYHSTVCEHYVKLYIKSELYFLYFTPDIHQIPKLSRTWGLIPKLVPQTLMCFSFHFNNIL